MKTEPVNNFLIETPKCAIYFDKNEHGLCAGIAVFEPYGASGWVSEVRSDPSHPFGALDKLFHLLLVSGASELWLGARERGIYEEVAPYFEPFVSRFGAERFTEAEQNELFGRVFDLRSLLTPLEHLNLESRPLAAQALARLASVCDESAMVPIASFRTFDPSGLLEIGNNALEQLEMLSSDPHSPSIARHLLRMRTPMGERLGRFWLCLPMRDAEELEKRYNWIDWVAPHTEFLLPRLEQTGDIVRIWREQGRGETHHGSELGDVVLHVGAIVAYCQTHKIPVLGEWENGLGEWFDEFRIRFSEPLWLRKQARFFGRLIDFLARLDVAASSVLASRRYGLCRPVIVDTAPGENFLQLMGLRHLLVEQQGRDYVPNDVVMGNRDYLDLPYPSTVMLDPRVHDGADIRGVMLYGINSSGKSSLMKSIGIAVVLAQAGFFVPARAMKFSLFEGVYTRIVSRDRVARSLSTFGVEMLELNAIFAHAGAKTLILGDEISRGTETLSAVAIVASTVMALARKGSLFVLTTHLHQLSMIKELSLLREVVSLHLSVRYDEHSDRLLYDRRLQAGRGSSIYGLEFARSLHMDGRFLDDAQRLRENLAKEYSILELGHQKETIKRYREVVASECVVCGALVRNQPVSLRSSEHHHRIPLCEKDRRAMAEGKIKVRGFIMTPQGLRLEYETQLQG